jgi:hypothetical protein
VEEEERRCSACSSQCADHEFTEEKKAAVGRNMDRERSCHLF